MKKVFVMLVALIGLGFNGFTQSLSTEQQEIINRQRAEIQQKRNQAADNQKLADENGRKCEVELRKVCEETPKYSPCVACSGSGKINCSQWDNCSSSVNYNHKFYCSNADCRKYIGECGDTSCHTTCSISTTCGCGKRNDQTKTHICN